MRNIRWSYLHNPWRSWTTNCAFAWRGLLVIWQGGAPQQLCLINYLAFIYHFHFQHSAWENKDSAQFSLCFGYQVGLLDQFPFQRSAFTPEEKEIIWKNENRLMCSAVNCKKNIILTKDHWLLVEAQSFSFLSSELCPTYVLYTGVFFPQHLLNEFARPKNIEARILLFEIAWQVNTKPEIFSFHLLYLRQPLPIHFSC